MEFKRAVELLQECDQGLRKLIAEAAGAGDLPSVRRIANWAEAVQAIAADAQSNGAVPPASMVSPDLSANPAKRGRFEPAVDEYPKFFRRGDELVKVGWSKKERKEYNHRAPRAAIDAAAAALKQIGAKGKHFNGDALLPLKDLTGSEVPGYQAYVALAWFRHIGAVEQHGRRGGYSLIAEKQVDIAIATEWPVLLDWRG